MLRLITVYRYDRFWVTVPLVATLALSATGCNDSGDDDDSSVAASPTAMPQFDPLLTLDPETLDFHSVGLGDTGSLELTIGNAGEGKLEISSIALEDSAALDVFQIAPVGPYDSISLGGTLTVTVDFAPQAEADYANALVITSNDPASPHRVTLAGNGTVLTVDADEDGYQALEAGGNDCDDSDPSIHPDAAEVPYNGVDEDCSGADDTDVDADSYVAVEAGGDDCDDTDAAVHPGAAEVPYNGLDDDCLDGDLADVDDDGFASSAIDGGDDCNDSDPAINPDAVDTAYNGIDEDCSGADLTDVDQDGYDGLEASGDDCDDADANTHPGASEYQDGEDNDCDGYVDEAVSTDDLDGDGYSPYTGDCNDDDASIYPGAPEVDYDGVDQDCDGLDVTDADGDGYDGELAGGGDCDDADPTVNPGATEICNELDDDCNEGIDEDVQTTWYADSDGDTFGEAANTLEACTAPEGYVSNGEDCDDANGTVYPEAEESCNGIDDDCDGDTDEAVLLTFYTDADGDTFGDANAPAEACNASTGLVADASDCDDSDPDVNPAALETCDLVDDDCDGQVDEDVTSTFYEDADQDGYGNAAVYDTGCEPASGYVADNTDCDDTRDDVNPGTAEVPYDDVDNDCADGDVVDADGDGYVATQAAGDDCDDTTANTHPGASELDDDQDNDCDGEIDEELNTTDDDGDGFSEALGDCDDADSSQYPGAPEQCNSADDDCDGTVDEDVKITFYRDSDGDTFGAASLTTKGCTAPSGYVEDGTDCDDTNSEVNPGATEVCNSKDDNCDGVIDEDVKAVYYRDVDGDGYGLSSYTIEACSATSGYAPIDGDCDDTRATVYPGATETCNGIDDNCDTQIDEGVATTYYRDGDSDTYGSSTSTTACTKPAGYVTVTGDCDDTRANVYPGATETCDQLDNDCDSSTDEGVTTTYYLDQDGDAYGTVLDTTQACSTPSGYSAVSTDCNDANSSIHPNATEQCNSVDDDCDSQIDEGVTTTWYQDVDGDTYGNPDVSQVTCTRPTGYVADNSDCDDTDATVNPGETEVCDGIDNNCNDDIDGPDAIDGTVWYYDGDTDGYGDGTVSITSCEQPDDFVENSVDCDDEYIWLEEEVCDGQDNDCDGDPDFTGGYPAVRVGYYARHVVTGDWNLDGHPDIATVNLHGSSVSFAFYTGGGTFSVRQTVSTGSTPVWAATGDWDGDGDPDMAVSNYSGASISILRNNGTGQFTASSTVTLGFTPYSLTSGDWDKDGDLDLAATNYSGGGVSLLKNAGGTFTLGSTVTTGTNAQGIAAGDWDKDGDSDLAVANYGADTVSVLKNNGSGTFTVYATATVGDGPVDLAKGDWNKDGYTDLAVANYNAASATILKGAGTGVFSASSTVTVGSSPYGITTGDWNGDGSTDLAIANYSSNTVSVLKNSGTGSFIASETAGTGYQTTSVAADDLDEDGDTDIITTGYSNGASNATAMVLRNNNGTFQAPGAFTVPSYPYHMINGDFNGDGLDDLVVNSYGGHTVGIYLQTADGRFEVASSTYVYYYPMGLATGDFDGDEDLDVAVTTGYDYNRVYILLNDGEGGMTSSYVSVEGRTYAVAAGDWDQDGDIDLAYTVYYASGATAKTVGILKNDGAANFSSSGTLTVGSYPIDIVAGDWDGDGDLDLACANYYSTNMSVISNIGAGSFAVTSSLSTSTYVYNLTTGDFDQDGYTDVASANINLGTVGLYFSNHTGSFKSAVTVAAGSQPFDVLSQDLDGDGDLDLAASNIGQGTVTLLMNQGAGVMSQTSYIGTPGTAYYVTPVGVGEAATPSIAVSSYYTDRVTILTGGCP